MRSLWFSKVKPSPIWMSLATGCFGVLPLIRKALFSTWRIAQNQMENCSRKYLWANPPSPLWADFCFSPHLLLFSFQTVAQANPIGPSGTVKAWALDSVKYVLELERSEDDESPNAIINEFTNELIGLSTKHSYMCIFPFCLVVYAHWPCHVRPNERTLFELYKRRTQGYGVVTRNREGDRRRDTGSDDKDFVLSTQRTSKIPAWVQSTCIRCLYTHTSNPRPTSTIPTRVQPQRKLMRMLPNRDDMLPSKDPPPNADEMLVSTFL